MNEVVIPTEVKTDIAARQAWARGLVIRAPADRTEAMDVLRAVKERCRTVMESFDASVKAAHAAHKAIVAQRDSFLAPLAEIERGVRLAVDKYDAEQERIRLAEQARLQAIADERARKERERLEREAARLKTPELKAERLAAAESIVAPVVTVPTAAPRTKGEAKVTLWRFRITDAGAIPREYLAVDEQKIGAVVRATNGTIAIPGVEIYSENQLRVRA